MGGRAAALTGRTTTMKVLVQFRRAVDVDQDDEMPIFSVAALLEVLPVIEEAQ